jgi:hypothetical protein
MSTYADKTRENKSQSVANGIAQKKKSKEATFQFVDNRPEAIVQKKQIDSIQNASNSHPLQKKENNTGLPDNLKSGIENISGHSMDDVKVHYNSDKPDQLNAHAYAQGTDIHLATGQEKHLPHEAWHVVQQKQGRVQPTMQMKGKVNVNDDVGLEKEADVMGVKALQFQAKKGKTRNTRHSNLKIVQRSKILSNVYQNLEPPTITIVKALMRWTGRTMGDVESDLNINLWGMTNPQYNALTDFNIPRPTSVHAMLDHNSSGSRDDDYQTGLGKMGNLEDLLKGRSATVYNGGHLLANQYGKFWDPNTNSPENMAPQAKTSNTEGGAWYNHEREVAANLELGKHLFFEAWVVYPSQTYSVPYTRIKNLLVPGSDTANALQDRLLYGFQSPEGQEDTQNIGKRTKGSLSNLGKSISSLAHGEVLDSVKHGLVSAGYGIGALWSGTKAVVDTAVGVKNQAYVTVNTWVPSQFNLKYTVLRGLGRGPRGAKKRSTFEGGHIGGIAELGPSVSTLLAMLKWWQIPLGSLASFTDMGTKGMALTRLGGDAALHRFMPMGGYNSSSLLGGTVIENQDHHLNDQVFEIINLLKDVTLISLAVNYLSIGGYSAANLAYYVVPYITPWLPGWISIGITPGLIATNPVIATALLIWLAYHKMPTIRKHLPSPIQVVLDKLGI